MTTTTTKREFPPKKLVPTDEPVLVYFAGKPPTPAKPWTKKTEQGDVVIQNANLVFRIADRNCPDLVGQPHMFQVKPWIAPGDSTKKPPRQATKSYQNLLAMLGEERAREFTYKDALAAEGDKMVTTEQWTSLEGFYVAYFNAPSKDRDSGGILMDERGGVAWQTIKELKSLKAVRWNLDDVKMWPPPRPDVGKPITPARSEPSNVQHDQQLPRPTTAPPIESPRPNRGLVLDCLKAFVQKGTEYGNIAKGFLIVKKADRVGALEVGDLEHLLDLMEIREHLFVSNGGIVTSIIENHLAQRGESLHELAASDARLLVETCDKAAADEVPF